MDVERPIILMDEQPPICPTCGRRLEISERPVEEDADGPIFAAACAEHGTWRVQDAPEEEDRE